VESVSVTQARAGKVLIEWAPVAGAEFYTVQYQAEHSSVWEVLPGAEHITRTTYHPRSLIKDQKYRFAVESVNEDGVSHGTPSEWVRYGATVPREPNHLLVKLVDKTTAHIEWKEPFTEQYPVQKYKVMVYEEGEQVGEGDDVAGHTSVDIDGLEPGTKYTFRIAARNEGGWGGLSPPTAEVKTRGRKPRSFAFIATWIAVEVLLVVLITCIVCVVWRRRQREVKTEHSYMELPYTGADDDLDSLADQEIKFAMDDDDGNELDFKGVLGDINERVHFRDFCESQGYLAHFRLFQTVEDYRRLGMMDRGQRARDIMRQYLNEGGDLYVSLHPMTLQRIKDTIAYGDSTPGADLFDFAQAEATAVLQLLSYPDYMRQRHGIQKPAAPFRGFGSVPPSMDSQALITDLPIHRSVLRMLASPGDRLRIEAVCEEVDPEAAAALAFVAAVEKFREREPEELPNEAHDIVERFMAGDSGLRVQFSQRVQQQLISTPKPHTAMFDDAQKEAMARLVGTICPNVFVSGQA